MTSIELRGHRAPRLTALVLGLVLVALVPLSSALAAGDAAAGKTLFAANCVSCHGADAAGGIKVGSATAPDVRWTNIGDDFKDPALVSRAILQGLDESGGPLDAAMPRFAGKLSATDADNIVVYLQGLAGPAAAAAPGALPKTGDPFGANLPIVLVLAAGVVLLAGASLRRSSNRA